MKGLSPQTTRIFQSIQDFELLKEYLLIGGSAIALQMQHRLSADLDFCKWQDDPDILKKEIQWPEIENFLKSIGSVKTEVIDLYQANFFLEEIKITFYSNELASSREVEIGKHYKKVALASLSSLGAMKLEVMSRRHLFRDYYDVYSILRAGISLNGIISQCGRYSRHRLKTKTILSILSNGSLFKKEENFSLLHPKYAVSATDIQEYMRKEIKRCFNR